MNTIKHHKSEIIPSIKNEEEVIIFSDDSSQEQIEITDALGEGSDDITFEEINPQEHETIEAVTSNV